MSIAKGRQVRVEVAATYGAAKTVTAVSKASPGVANSTAHAMVDGTIGYFSAVTGMDELLNQACSVDAPTTNDFTLESLNTTDFGTFTSGTFTPVATWSTLSTSTSYEIGGGAADKIDMTTLLDRIKQEDVGMLAAQTINISGFSDPQNAAYQLIRTAALAGSAVTMRITLLTGERRVFRGIPSLPGESVAVGGAGTGSFEVSVKGQVMLLPA